MHLTLVKTVVSEMQDMENKMHYFTITILMQMIQSVTTKFKGKQSAMAIISYSFWSRDSSDIGAAVILAYHKTGD